MIGKKCGKNSLKKIVLVQTKAQFQQLIGINSCSLYQKKQKIQQQIIVPKYSLIQSPCPPRNISLPPNYIKTFKIKSFMSNLIYELDEIDNCFLNKINLVNNQKLFVDIIQSLQKCTHKFGRTQINYKNIIKKIFKKYNIQIGMGKSNSQQIVRQIYNYWRNKRKNMRCSLLRKFWEKTEVGPYKLRGETSLCLRNRTIKVQNDVAYEILKQDLLALKKILLLMRTRQIQQRKLIIAQTQSFEKLSKQVLKKVKKQLQSQRNKQQFQKQKSASKLFKKNTKNSKLSQKNK